MALNKDTLKTAILAAINAAETASKAEGANNATIKENLADAIAVAVETFVKTARITIAPNTVNVTGSSSAQTNPSQIVISNSID